MQLVVGDIIEGKVTGITNFGVFVDIGEGKSGMVHISEVAQTYVNQISDFVKQGDVVKAKVLSVSDEGKISLSIKKLVEQPKEPAQKPQRPMKPRGERRPAPNVWNGQKSNAYEESYSDETVDLGGGKQDAGKSQSTYSGPSVLSYTLDGRKASKLPIPAYRCYAGGEVTVIIVVNPQGSVIGAEVKDDISSTDQCLRNFAVRAARLSKFSQSSTAPARQTGEIVYRFIAQ